MIVVSDTSPIRALHHLGLLMVLEHLFSEVLIPPAVAHELQHPRGRFVPVDLSALPFARIKAPAGVDAVTEIDPGLDLGETEALALAMEESADVLIDESAGRAAATKLGLRVTGTLGILLEAKSYGLLQEVRSPMDRLRQGLGFHISDQLRAAVLQDAGE